jgi:hypothetical protein
MIELILSSMLVTVVPDRTQFYCKLEWIERGLCVYWCANEYKAFKWFEVESEKGCKIRKKFHLT